MTSLRSSCIEAMAEAVAEHLYPLTWSDALWRRQGLVDHCTQEAEAAFDALLSTLTAHADEWESLAAHKLAEPVQETAFVLELLAVLGGTGDQPTSSPPPTPDH